MTTRNVYSRPAIKVKNWLVTKDDVKKIYDFLIRRYKASGIEISLETTSGNNKIYESFKEFENDIDSLRALKENIEQISLSHSAENRSDRTHIWATIHFSYKTARFHIVGEGGPKIKDWIDGSFEEMKRVARSFELEDKKMIKLLKNEFGEEWMDKTTVVEDFWGEIKKRLELKLKKPPLIKTALKEGWHTTWWGKIIIGLTISLVAGFILYTLFGN